MDICFSSKKKVLFFCVLLLFIVTLGNAFALTAGITVDLAASTINIDGASTVMVDVSGYGGLVTSKLVVTHGGSIEYEAGLLFQMSDFTIDNWRVNLKETKTGVYTFVFTITDSSGQTAEAIHEVNLTGIEPVVSVTSVVLSNIMQTMTLGENYQLTATVFPVDASDREVIWSSSDSSIITVDQNGVVIAIAPGEAIVYASAKADESIKGQCNFSVNEPEPTIMRGDATDDRVINIEDLVSVINHIILEIPPASIVNADANVDKVVNLVDLSRIVNFLVNGVEM